MPPPLCTQNLTNCTETLQHSSSKLLVKVTLRVKQKHFKLHLFKCFSVTWRCKIPTEFIVCNINGLAVITVKVSVRERPRALCERLQSSRCLIPTYTRRVWSKVLTTLSWFFLIGGSLELPMWLTDGFLVTFFWKVVGSCAHTRESRTATVHGATVHGELTCGGGGNINIHVYLQLLYTVNSRVVVGAIYAYMCTYSYRTRCTVHGVLTCGGGGNIRIHVYLQLPYMCAPYTVYSRVVVGAIYAYMCTYSYRTRCTVHGELTCDGGGNICIHVYLQLPYTVNSRVEGVFTCGELLTCAGDIHVWELLTCETSHQSEILHSLIFYGISVGFVE